MKRKIFNHWNKKFQRFEIDFGRYAITLLVGEQLLHDENKVYQVTNDMVLVDLRNHSSHFQYHVLSSHEIHLSKI